MWWLLHCGGDGVGHGIQYTSWPINLSFYLSNFRSHRLDQSTIHIENIRVRILFLGASAARLNRATSWALNSIVCATAGDGMHRVKKKKICSVFVRVFYSDRQNAMTENSPTQMMKLSSIIHFNWNDRTIFVNSHFRYVRFNGQIVYKIYFHSLFFAPFTLYAAVLYSHRNLNARRQTATTMRQWIR